MTGHTELPGPAERGRRPEPGHPQLPGRPDLLTDTGLRGVLSLEVLTAIQKEATRAHAKHGPYSMLGPHYDSGQRLAIVAEEVGEAAELVEALLCARLTRMFGSLAHELTYDAGGPAVGEGREDRLQTELTQVGAMVATWLELIRKRLLVRERRELALARLERERGE